MLDRTTPPPVYMMGNLTLPIPETEILPNGIVLHNIVGGSQAVNQLSLTWPGGLSETKKEATAKIMSKVMREGTKSMTGTELSEAIDFNGAMLKTTTDSHFTGLTVSALNSKTASVLPIIRDIICEATYPEQAFTTYRDIEIKEFLLAQSNVIVLAHNALSPMIKGADHPNAHIQTVEEIASVSRDEVIDYYRQVVTADGCHAFLSGNIDLKTKDAVRDMLMHLPSPHPKVALDIVPYHAEAPGIVEVKKEGAQQAAVSMALIAPKRTNPDYIPLRFTTIALGGYFGSRLMKNIREDKGYTYGIGAYLLGAQEGSYIAISAQTDNKYIDLLIEEVRNELTRLATEPLSDDELIRLKQHISSSLMETMDSPFSIMDYYRTIECIGLPNGYFESQVDWVHRITPDIIMEMARKYMQPDQLRIAICSSR